MRWLAGITLLLTGADHWTTYLCLRSPVLGWEIVEANPIADWLFQLTGLVPGLLIDSVVTLGAIGFLCTTSRFPVGAKVGLLTFIAGTTGFAVVNNVQAMAQLGLLPAAIG